MNLVTAEDNIFLTTIPSHLEIRNAIFDLDASSVAWPDGFNGDFYHHYWDLIQMDICAAIQDFFKLGVVLQCLNSDLVVLLPNVLGAFSIT